MQQNDLNATAVDFIEWKPALRKPLGHFPTCSVKPARPTTCLTGPAIWAPIMWRASPWIPFLQKCDSLFVFLLMDCYLQMWKMDFLKCNDDE